MKIAFWSNVRGHSGVTSNLACNDSFLRQFAKAKKGVVKNE